MERVTRDLVPSSIRDERGSAFGQVLADAAAEPDFRRLLLEEIDAVPDELLPFLIREFSIEEFADPDMTPAVIRRLLKASYAIHARKGFIDSVRNGLAMLGIGIVSWRQWFQSVPKATPGTHIVTLSVSDEVFAAEGNAITWRLQRAIGRMLNGTKRFSQYIAVRFRATSVPATYAGAAVVTRLVVKPSTAPITSLYANSSVFIGAAVSTRLRVTPKV